MQEILAALKGLLPAMLPEVESLFDSKAIPALQAAIEASAASPDVKVVEQALVSALKVIGDIEIPKI